MSYIVTHPHADADRYRCPACVWRRRDHAGIAVAKWSCQRGPLPFRAERGLWWGARPLGLTARATSWPLGDTRRSGPRAARRSAAGRSIIPSPRAKIVEGRGQWIRTHPDHLSRRSPRESRLQKRSDLPQGHYLCYESRSSWTRTRPPAPSALCRPTGRVLSSRRCFAKIDAMANNLAGSGAVGRRQLLV